MNSAQTAQERKEAGRQERQRADRQTVPAVGRAQLAAVYSRIAALSTRGAVKSLCVVMMTEAVGWTSTVVAVAAG